MKNILIIFAILMVLAACAPPAPQAGQQLRVPPKAPIQEAVPQQAYQPPVVEQPPQQAMGAISQVHDVQINGFKFLPAVITIKAGDAVRWTNRDNVPHTATSGTFDTGALAKGQSEQITFDKPGTYEYGCTFHPSMRAQVIVQ